METETRILLECKDRISHDNLHDNGGKSLIASSSFSNNKISQQPVKKPTRQWAAWTREEEESFFTALRQVGKNFEKITCCVQSKNKDQVRHYYYRLVRRMNKLLGPSFCLDAKNSKDTNAAMLRWWSLLEKYSCKASKLHLKPRRFKIFIEALEHQLLKDRKKNSRKRSSLGENCPPLSPTSLSIQSKQSGNANCAVKFVLVDSRNIQKGGNGRGSTAKRISNTGANRSRGDLSPTKASRQRRKPGEVLSAAAVKRWEKAAIAGMSLVADAAEHLERLAGGKKEAENHSALTCPSSLAAGCNNEISLSLTKQAPSPVQNFDCDAPPESSTKSTMKLKLQLFPIDDVTRQALEMDKHNPHLELTLSTRKKVASVLEHLNRKWGASTVACGDLMLFPYTAQREHLPRCQRWNQDSFVSAADVHAAIGNPPVFRLRYGWVSVSELQSSSSLVKLDNSEQKSLGEACTEQLCMDTSPTPGSWNEQLGRALSSDEINKASTSDIPAVAQYMTDLPEDATGFAGPEPKINLFNSLGFESAVWPRSEAQGAFVAREMESTGVGNTTEQSADEWADSLTNISVGDLLAGDIIDTACVEANAVGTSCFIEANPFSCDSFDAAIAAHLSNHRNKMGFQSATSASHPLSSIWDAEETRDAFSFQNQSSTSAQIQNPSKVDLSPKICGDIFRENFADGRIKDLPEEEEMVDSAADDEEPMVTEGRIDPCLLGNSSKDTNALTDTYWPDSLGPLDLNELGSCKYYSQEMILSDSLGGLSQLIASSLDALQNCSLFISEKKDASLSAAAAELQGNTSTFDNRIGGV